MATDGVKIIDGDLANDLYAHFMIMYDEGSDIETLIQQFEDDKEDCSSDKFSYEICITVYALVFWEIGELTPRILKEVEKVIAEKNSVKIWTDSVGEKAGKERQKELDKLLKKISNPNLKPRKRKRSKKTVRLFETGDVLMFQYPGKMYGVAFVADIDEMYGFCFYSLCRINYKSDKQPEMKNINEIIENATIYADEIPTVDEEGKEITRTSAYYDYIAHKDLTEFSSSFNKIGSIPFEIKLGQSLLTKDFQSFCDTIHAENSISFSLSRGMKSREYSFKDVII